MDDMVGIANRLPAMSEVAAQRLERALAVTDAPSDGTARQPELLAKRDALLQLAEARA
jgi:beta-N-acetylhexosaminidase